MWAQLGLVIGLIVGVGLAAQGAMNARLAANLGGAVPAAVISFVVGLTTLMILTLATRQPIPSGEGIQNAPWWALLGGIAGASVVTGAAFFVPKIGVTTWIAVIIAGQLLGAVIIDHQGWLGTEVREANLPRILGIALLAMGVFLIQRGSE